MKKEKNLYYEKVRKYYFNVYDVKNYGLNVAEFESIEDLKNWINKATNKNYSTDYIRHTITNKYIISDRYEVIKDSIAMIENVKDF